MYIIYRKEECILIWEEVHAIYVHVFGYYNVYFKYTIAKAMANDNTFKCTVDRLDVLVKL